MSRKVGLGLTTVNAIILPIALLALRKYYLGNRTLVQQSLYSALESAGSAIGLFSGVFIFSLYQRGYRGREFAFTSSALICMGTFGLIHSALPSSYNLCVWLEILDGLGGAIFAVGAWLSFLPMPTRGVRANVLPLSAFVLSLTFSILSIVYQQDLPIVNGPQGFTTLTTVLGFTTFVLNAVAAYWFLRNFYRTCRSDNLLLGNFFLLSGITSWLPHSYVIWGPIWWSWTCLQFMGYLLLILYFAILYLRLESKLRNMTNELQRSNRQLEAYASLVSHDLREPLRMVSSFVSLLAQRSSPKLDEKSKEYIGFALLGTERMREIIDRFLSLASLKSSTLSLERVKMNDVVRDVSLNLKIMLEESQAEIESSDLPEVVCDRILISQVVQNIVQNAIKYCDGRSHIRIFGRRQDGECRYSIEDNGPGISEEVQSRVFEIYHRSTSKGSGAGIGLAVCRAIVEKHGGKLWFVSRPDQGTTFTFSLPSAPSLSPSPT